MTLQPETLTTIYTRVRDAIIAASDINNFSENSPERAITEDGFSEEMVERQHEALAVQLSARVDYAGKGTDDSEQEIDEDDLEDMGIPNPEYVDLELLNSFVKKEDLDEFAKRNGISRDPGSFATGEVTITTTSDTVTIPEGTEVATEPDSEGDYLSFETDSETSPSQGSTSVKVSVTAAERGSEHNVGSGSITYLPSPPPGVDSVTNNNATTGGEDEETNADFRERTKEVLVRQAVGGTVDGVEGSLVSRFDGLDLNDVVVDEFDQADPQYFDVIVDGGPSDTDLEDEIDELEPVAVEGKLVRPTDITVDVTADVSGSDIDSSAVESEVSEYLTDLGLEDDLVRDSVIAAIMNADNGITDIDSLTVTISGETHTYDSGSTNHPLYKLNKGDSMAPDSSTNGNGIVAVDDASGNTYTEGTDFDEGTVDGSSPDAIDWGVGGSSPDDPEDFSVDYDIEDNIPIGTREKVDPGSVIVNVV